MMEKMSRKQLTTIFEILKHETSVLISAKENLRTHSFFTQAASLVLGALDFIADLDS